MIYTNLLLCVIKKTYFVQTAWKVFSFFINRYYCTLGLQSFRRHFHWSERKIRLTEAADSGAWSGKRIVYDPLLTWFTFLQTHKKIGHKVIAYPFFEIPKNNPTFRRWTPPFWTQLSNLAAVCKQLMLSFSPFFLWRLFFEISFHYKNQHARLQSTKKKWMRKFATWMITVKSVFITTFSCCFPISKIIHSWSRCKTHVFDSS